MIVIRQATALDIPWLIQQLHAMDDLFGSSRGLFPSLDYAETFIGQLIDSQPFLVADMDSGPVGFLSMHIGPHVLNPERTVCNALFWWVQPQHRGSRASYQLLRAFIAIGKQRAHMITMTVQPYTPVDPSSLTGLGFEPADITYLMRVA